ncbi:hypothetical protein CEN49_26220 [Fischerella thermalis CCMEE 5273]|nr:hypothetical protein CEN49_26220 [Fischerella thermalis CCMEE 5273]
MMKDGYVRKIVEKGFCPKSEGYSVSIPNVYKGEEFDKPSPLAAKVNGGAANGWEYIEVKKNDQWIRLEELRQIWRSTNDKK